MSKRPILILAAIIVLFFIAYKFFKPDAVKQGLAKITAVKSAFAFTPAEIDTRLKKIEETLPAIEQAIAAHRFQEGRDLLDTTFYPLRRGLREGGDTALDGGRKLSSELAALEKRLAETAHREFETQLTKIAEGGNDTATVHRLVRNFSGVGGSHLSEELTARAPELDKRRRVLAGRWIRINAESTGDDYEEMTFDHIVKTLVLPSGFTLVFGPAMGPAEDETTFATLTFKVKVSSQNYFVHDKEPDPANQYFLNRGEDGLLEAVTIDFRTRLAFRGYHTSWDHSGDNQHHDFSQIDIKLPVPDRFEFTVPEGGSYHDEFKTRNVPRVAALKKKLAEALVALPPLDFAPEKNSPSLSRQGALLNEAAFTQAAGAALAAGKPAGDIACIAVEQGIEPLADRIEAKIEKLSLEERQLLALSLKARPWYHGYATLNKMIASSPPQAVPLLFEAAARDLDQPTLLATARARALREKDPSAQGGMLAALVSFSPPATLPEFVKLYPTLGGFPQSALLNALMLRDRGMAARFALQLVDTTQSTVLESVTDAMQSALTSINSGRKMALTSDEQAVFVQAIAKSRGGSRERILGRMPNCEELIGGLLQDDRSAWTEAENLALYDHVSVFRYNADRETRIVEAIFKSMKAGRLDTPTLARKAQGVLSPIANILLRTRGDEAVKIPLILQVIDERSRPNSQTCAQTVTAMIISLEPAEVLAHPDGHTLLAKGKAYANEPNWAKFMDQLTTQVYGQDYPGQTVRAKINELIAAAAAADPAYRDLL